MSRGNDPENFNPDDFEHPALKNYSRTASQAKHVLGKGFTWGLVGALIGGAVFAAAGATLIGGGLLVSGPIGWIIGGIATLTGIGLPAVGAGVATMAIAGAKIGGIIGAASGAGFGLTSMSDAADEEEDKRVMKYDQAMMRQRRMQDLQRIRDQQMAYAYGPMGGPSPAMGMMQNPNMGLPRQNYPGGPGMMPT